MGCAVSKSEHVQEFGLRPMLRQRLEEFTARRHGGLSKKQLLAADAILISRDSVGEEDDDHDDHNDIPNNQQIIVPPLNDDESFQFTQQSPPTPQIIIPTIENNVNFSSLLPDKNHDHDHDDSDHDKVNNDNDIKEEEKDDDKIIKVQELKMLSKDSSSQEEEELNFEEVENMNVCPGSPSFRVYCIHSVDDELEGKFFYNLLIFSSIN